MRSTDLCTPKPILSSTRSLVAFPARVPKNASCPRRASFSAGAVLVHANVSIACVSLEVGRNAHRTARGHRCETRLGRIALHDAGLTSAPGRASTRVVLFPTGLPIRSPLALLSPPSIRRSREACVCRLLSRIEVEGRQDRFRGGLVKGVRIPDPERLPSAVATRIERAPERACSIVRCSTRSGAHVMRIAVSPRAALRLPRRGPFACARGDRSGQAPVHELSNDDRASDPATADCTLL